VTVFHRKLPPTLPPGQVLVIEPSDSSALWKVEEPLQNPVVASQAKDSPLMAHVRLDQVFMPEARKLVLQAPAQVLAESATGDPLYAVIERPEGKVVVLTVNLDKGDLTLQTAFPILMTNLLSWFREGKGELLEALATGAVAEVQLTDVTGPGSVGGLSLRGAKGDYGRFLRAPDGSERPLPAEGAKVAVGPLDRCGLWSIVRRPARAEGAPPGKPETLIELACNLANRRESDLRPATTLPEHHRAAASALGARPVWYYLIAVAWALTTWEWFLYQRRWID
jgi:hypothetical protein